MALPNPIDTHRRKSMESDEVTNEQRDALLSAYSARVMALEVMVRALAKTHPNPAALVEAIRYYEEAQKRSLLGHVHPFVTEMLQSFQDQAGLG